MPVMVQAGAPCGSSAVKSSMAVSVNWGVLGAGVRAIGALLWGSMLGPQDLAVFLKNRRAKTLGLTTMKPRHLHMPTQLKTFLGLPLPTVQWTLLQTSRHNLLKCV